MSAHVRPSMTREAKQVRSAIVSHLQNATTELEWDDYKELIISLSKTLEEECRRIGAAYWNDPAPTKSGGQMTIFVFGSNLAGKHYGGAAKYALEKFGAQMGIDEGLTGQSYALPTMDENFKPRSLSAIEAAADVFKMFAIANPELEFYITRVGCGIAGFKDEQIAPFFVGSPSNCTFDPLWAGYGTWGLPSWKEVL